MASTPVSQAGANIQGSSQPELDADAQVQQTKETISDSYNARTAQPQSPLPESDYDKLLVSRTSGE